MTDCCQKYYFSLIVWWLLEEKLCSYTGHNLMFYVMEMIFASYGNDSTDTFAFVIYASCTLLYLCVFNPYWHTLHCILSLLAKC